MFTRPSRPASLGKPAGAGALCAALLLGLLPACSGSLPKPPTGPVPPEAMVEIPYPPPPARSEIIPPQKKPADVWIDGQWEWDGKDWKWLAGTWMTPPANAYFTRWTAQRRPDGRLFFAHAAWRRRDGRPLDLGAGGLCPVAPAPLASEVARR